jgi:hypothetical protein
MVDTLIIGLFVPSIKGGLDFSSSRAQILLVLSNLT